MQGAVSGRQPGFHQLVMPRPRAPSRSRAQGGGHGAAGLGGCSPTQGRKTLGRGEQSSYKPLILDVEYLEDSWKRFKQHFDLSPSKGCQQEKTNVALSKYIFFVTKADSQVVDVFNTDRKKNNSEKLFKECYGKERLILQKTEGTK